MRRTLGILLILAACGETTDIEPRAPAPATASTASPSPPVPAVSEGPRLTPLPVPACVVRGMDVELAQGGLPLALDDGGPAYASVDRADAAELRLEADAQGTRATLEARVGDATVLGWVRRESVPVHPGYVATFADVVVLRRFHVTAVRDADLDTTVTAPPWTLPAGTPPLAPRVHRCRELSLGPGPRSVSSTGPLRRLRPDATIPVRRAPHESPRLTLAAPAALRPGIELETKGGLSRMWLPAGDVDLVGWIDSGSLIDPTPGLPRLDRDPLPAPTGGVRCDAEVPLYVKLGGVARRIGSLARGAPLVTHGEGTFVAVDIGGALFAAPGTTFVVRRADVAKCPR